MKALLTHPSAQTLFACLAACLSLTPAPTLSAPKKLLVVTESRGFTHSVVKRGPDGLCLTEKVLAEIGRESGVFETVNAQSAIEVLTADNLKNYDAIFFYTTGTLVPAGQPREALLEFVKAGKAFIGAHSATDTFADFKGYFEFINGTFNGHPWGAGTTGSFVNHEPTHPTVSMFPTSFQFKDEIYQYKNYDPSAVRVLISLDMAGSKPQMPYHVPVCWVREYGQGRLFYTNLGHNDATWLSPQYRAHLLAGIRWAMKLQDGPASPNPDVQHLEHAKSFLVVHAPALKQDWTTLYAKLQTKAKSNSAFLAQLRQNIDACNQLPTPDPKKHSPEQAQALKSKQLAAVTQIVETITQ